MVVITFSSEIADWLTDSDHTPIYDHIVITRYKIFTLVLNDLLDQ